MKKDNLPLYEPGLKRDLVNIFRLAVGRRNAIPRERLIKILNWQSREEGKLGLANFERTMRLAIVELRHEGVLICSTGGTGGGYWLAENWDELREFTTREYHSRAISMLATEKAMKEAARKRWGSEPVEQLKLL